MTIEEASQRYHIPLPILKAYESWALDGAQSKETWQVDGQDLQRLSLVMTLCDSGFSLEEVEQYMRLLAGGPSALAEQGRILEQKRSSILEAIHLYEGQLEKVDYLRYHLQVERRK